MAVELEPAPVRAGHPPAALRGNRGWDVAVVAAPAVLAIVLCLYELSARSLWLDEAATVAIASQHGSALWNAMAHDGGNMLGYYLLLHVVVGFFGDGASVIRLPSVVASGACAGAVSLLALRVFGRRAAGFAGLLTAASLPLVFWGQNARGYAAMTALVAGSFAALVSMTSHAPDARRRGPWIAYVACTALSVYASYVAILALPAQLVALAWRRDPLAWRRVLSAIAVCAVCWIPLAVLAVTRGSAQLFWIPRPGLTVEKQVALALTSAGFEPNFHPTWAAGVLAILTVVLVLIGALAVLRRPRWGDVVVLSWLVVPVGLMWLESLLGQPIFTPRNLLVALPAVALLIGWLIAQSRFAWPSLVVLIVLRAVVLVPSYGTSPEDWRAATAYVLGSERAGDCRLFYPQDARMPFAYYAGEPVVPYIERYEAPQLPAGCARVWLVVSHQGQPSGPPAVRAHYARYVALRAALGRAYAHERTRRFGYASKIWVELFYGRSVVPTNVSALRSTSSTPFTASSAVKARPRT
jgi:mannosyltransferase